MNLPDTNVWLALCLSRHQFHAAAAEWLANEGADASVLFCRSTAQSLVRLLTTDAVMALYDLPAMTNTAAWQLYRALRADPRIGFANEPTGLEEAWGTLAAGPLPSPKLWMDAYLAAFAMTANHLCVTTDRGFKQFKDLKALILGKT